MELKIFLLYSSVLFVLLVFYFKVTRNCCLLTCVNCCIDNAEHCYLFCNMLRLKFNKTQCSGTASLMHRVLNLFLHFKGVMSRGFCFLAKNCTKYLTKHLWLLHKRLLEYEEKKYQLIPSRKNKSIEFINDFSKTLRRTNFLFQVAIQAFSSQRSLVSYSFIVNKTETLFSDFLCKLNVYFFGIFKVILKKR